jgi:hypothetical protein
MPMRSTSGMANTPSARPPTAGRAQGGSFKEAALRCTVRNELRNPEATTQVSKARRA